MKALTFTNKKTRTQVTVTNYRTLGGARIEALKMFYKKGESLTSEDLI